MTAAIHTSQVDRARRLARKVARNARDKNEWRKVVKFRLWMPVALQVLLIVALLWYTETRFDGFMNRANITTTLLLAMPLALTAIAQTHALLVGYLDLSVGAMISLGVVVGSFLIGGDASWTEILIGIAATPSRISTTDASPPIRNEPTTTPRLIIAPTDRSR